MPNFLLIHTLCTYMSLSSSRLFHGEVCFQVEGPKQDLHSGVYGGTVIEPMTDLIGILGECIYRQCTFIYSFIQSLTHRYKDIKPRLIEPQ